MIKARLFFFTILLLLTHSTFSQEITCFISSRQQQQSLGLVMAQEKGIYKKFGLHVTFVVGSKNIAYSYLAKKKVMFAPLLLPTAIKLYSSKEPIVNVAQILNSSSFMVVAKKSSGIKSIKDLNNKKIGVFGGEQQVVCDAFIKYYNLNVTQIPRGNSVNLLLMDCVEALIVRSYDDFHYIINSGIDSTSLTAFYFKDSPLNFPEDGLYCLEKTYKSNPELCRKFIRATLEGWKFAADNPSETIECVMRYVKTKNVTMNHSQMKWIVNSLRGLVNRDKNNNITGQLLQSDYDRTAQFLQKLGLVKQTPQFTSINRSN